MARLFRLIKLLRLLRSARILNRVKTKLGWTYLTFSMLQFAAILIFLTHLMACIWGAGAEILQGEDDEAINYFVDHIPRLKKLHPQLRIFQFVQGPGETVFIPGGWWHAVLNLVSEIK